MRKKSQEPLPPRDHQKTLGENDQMTRDNYRIPTPTKTKFFRDLKKAIRRK
jgi:hypothetical protein